MMPSLEVSLPDPQLQVDFAFALGRVRVLYLLDALRETVEGMEIAAIDRELAEYVPNESLVTLARQGLRGELAFAVPCILEKNPRLLGYYRLLLGYSKKAFYSTSNGTNRLKAMEEEGVLSAVASSSLPALSKAMIQSACYLVEGIGADGLNPGLLDDLTLLTLGPQFRGGENVKLGTVGIAQVFEVIHSIVKDHAVSAESNRIELRNPAGRTVLIEFASDPDIIIREQMAKDSFRNLVAIEVKAGKDNSNIHNRLGEAEKSHRKAVQTGYTEFWTVTNVANLDLKKAKRETPTTNRFYSIPKLLVDDGPEYADFRNRIIGLTGIPDAGQEPLQS